MRYHDCHAIMTTDVGAPAPRGHCSACWDDKEQQPLREVRVYANREEVQSAACVYCRINNRGGCDAFVVDDEMDDEASSPEKVGVPNTMQDVTKLTF